jgi:hypothetical protein
MGTPDRSRMKGCKAIIKGMQNQYDKMCNTERVEGFMAPFEYRGDASVSTTSSSNDASLLDTKLHPLTSGRTGRRAMHGRTGRRAMHGRKELGQGQLGQTTTEEKLWGKT